MDAAEYRYNRLTWPEMNAAIARQPVVLLPTGSTEQHGRHLPIDTDLFLGESVCLEVGQRAGGGVLVLPPVPYGLNLHHIDFPGTIHIEPEVFIAFCLNVTKSVAYHGFEKILVVNSHGSNAPLVDVVARRTTLETGSLCAACHYPNLAIEEFRTFKDTETIAHADEFETSLYLHLAPGAGPDGAGRRHRGRDGRLPLLRQHDAPTPASTTTGRAGPTTASTATPAPRRPRRGAASSRRPSPGSGAVREWRAWPGRRAARLPRAAGAGGDSVVGVAGCGCGVEGRAAPPPSVLPSLALGGGATRPEPSRPSAGSPPYKYAAVPPWPRRNEMRSAASRMRGTASARNDGVSRSVLPLTLRAATVSPV
jgi:creatinine amidohydrolase/Fe(II)-dependent formamide hydrolase-like protein